MILGEFVEGLGETISVMHDAMANNHHEQLQRMAHQLKGAGGGYGYFCLMEMAKVLEDAARAEDSEAARQVLQELRELCKAIEAGHQAHTAVKGTEL